MRFLHNALRPAAALLLVAHGLAHAVLPLRGGMDPARLHNDFGPFILYAVSVLGFTVAAVGLLNVKPFGAVIRPAMVLASAYSLVAISVFGQGNMAWAAALDIVLLVVGVTAAYRFLPAAAPSRHKAAHAVARTFGLAVIAYAVAAAVLWPLHRSWGSLPAEHALALPGDLPNRSASFELQHAVTIHAAPEAVWPWLVQIGQDRAGFYSYDWLERAFGVNIHNADRIHPEWQERRRGDRVHATQPDYLHGVLGKDLGWTVREVEPNRAIVLGDWGSFVLEPTSDGETRFIIRTKVGNAHMPAWAAPLDMMAFELPHFIMQRKMMLRIKALSEKNAANAL